MTVIGALSSFRKRAEMSPHKHYSSDRPIAGEKLIGRSPETRNLSVEHL